MRRAPRIPCDEFGITLSLANSLLLPNDGDKLWRPDAEGRIGYYSGHVYRDCLVDPIPAEKPAPIDFLVIVSPVCGISPSTCSETLRIPLRSFCCKSCFSRPLR